MPRQRKAVRIRSGPAAADDSRLWLTRAALGLAGLALVGIAAFLLGHQQGADSVIDALRSQGVQTLPDKPDTTPPGEQQQADEVPGDEPPVEQAPAEKSKPADSADSADSAVEAVGTEENGSDEDRGAAEVSVDRPAGDSPSVALDAAVHVPAPTPVSDSGAADALAEPVGAPKPDLRAASLEQPEAPLREAAQPEFPQPAVQRQVAAAPVERTPQVRSESSAPVAEPRPYSAGPRQVTPRPGSTQPDRVEPQEIGTNTVSTIGANEVVLVSRG